MMKNFPAKLLLFGEYGLMFGAKALALPSHRYHGKLIINGNTFQHKQEEQSHWELKKFAVWLKQQNTNQKLNFPLLLDALDRDISNGLFFQSDIPLRYGVGSSGALCAALYDTYGTYPQHGNQLQLIKQDLSTLEACFHGRSSGLDPLVSLFNQPILLENEEVLLLQLQPNILPWEMHLIDTGITSATSPLVHIFLNKMKNPEFARHFNENYLPANDGAVEAFIAGDADKLFEKMELITHFQVKHLSEMIPPTFLKSIKEYAKRHIFIKLLGSGGGGYLLAFVPKETNFDIPAKSFQIFNPG